MKEVATFSELRGSQRPATEDVRMNDTYALIVCATHYFSNPHICGFQPDSRGGIQEGVWDHSTHLVILQFI